MIAQHSLRTRAASEAPLRVAFVTGTPSRVRARGLAVKHLLMRLQGLVYPDVYALPYFFTDRLAFLPDGAQISRDRYDLVFSELNRSERQLRYIHSLLAGGGPPLIIVPGPPDLLEQGLTPRKFEYVRGILSGAAQIWAYSDSVRDFCDGVLDEQKASTIPWPFDCDAVRRLGDGHQPAQGGDIRILLNVPMRFSGTAASDPFVLKSILGGLLAGMPARVRERFAFFTFVYTDEDRRRYHTSGLDRVINIRIARKRGFTSFVRFVSNCDAVVNLTAGAILGRITFIAAALERPGLFSDNAQLSRVLYPSSTADIQDIAGVRDMLAMLLEGLASGNVRSDFLPSKPATTRVGDFAANAAQIRKLVDEIRL